MSHLWIAISFSFCSSCTLPNKHFFFAIFHFHPILCGPHTFSLSAQTRSIPWLKRKKKKLIALMILIKANRFDLVLFIYFLKNNHVLSTWLPLTWAASSVARCAVTPTWHEKRKWNGPRVKHRVIHKQNLKYLWAQVRSLVTSTHRRILSTVATLFILSSLRSLSFELELTCLLFRKPHKILIKKTFF